MRDGKESSTRSIGKLGEIVAAEYLRSQDYEVLKTNWSCRYGELDIIAKDGQCLVFTEVKYVQNTNFCDAVDLFSARKRRNLVRTTLYFVHSRGLEKIKWRMDLLCVTRDEGRYWIEQYKNILAF
jgi:putative endonuclease